MLLALPLLALAAVVAVGAVEDRAAPERRAAPTFELPSVRPDGGPVALPAGRPAVVNFFGSWCEPCRDELPVLEAASRRYRGQVAFIGIDLYEPADRGAAMLDELGVTFAAGSDPKGHVASEYRLRGNPSTAFVDAQGNLVDVVPGALKRAEIERRIDQILTLRTKKS